MMKQLIAFWVLGLSVVLAGCAGQNQDSSLLAATVEPAPAVTAVTSPTYRVALVMKTLTNPFFVEMERGARQAEQEFGINLIVKTAAQETSIEQQIEIVDELVREKVDAIVVAPGDSVELIPVLKKAQDAGIVVINIDVLLDPEFSEKLGLVNVPYISVDNEHGAYLSVKYISDQIHAPTQAVILEGIPTARNAQDRKNGALRAFGENSAITVVAVETAHWKIDEGYDVTKELFTRYPDIGAMFCSNDMMALGALNYLEETNRSHVLVAAYDALDAAKEAIRDGKLAVTIDQQAALQGYTGVAYAVKALRGEKNLPAETMLEVFVVDTNSVN